MRLAAWNQAAGQAVEMAAAQVSYGLPDCSSILPQAYAAVNYNRFEPMRFGLGEAFSTLPTELTFDLCIARGVGGLFVERSKCGATVAKPASVPGSRNRPYFRLTARQ